MEDKPFIDIGFNTSSSEDLKKYPKLNNPSGFIQLQFFDNGIGFEP